MLVFFQSPKTPARIKIVPEDVSCSSSTEMQTNCFLNVGSNRSLFCLRPFESILYCWRAGELPFDVVQRFWILLRSESVAVHPWLRSYRCVCAWECLNGFYGAYNCYGLVRQVSIFVMPVSVRRVSAVFSTAVFVGWGRPCHTWNRSATERHPESLCT